jgi:predicted phosphodiesterase
MKANPDPMQISTALLLEALRRFPGYSDRSVAHYIMRRQPEIFKGFETTRNHIRRLRGHTRLCGRSIEKQRHPSLPAEIVMPPTSRKIRTDYKLPHGTWGIMVDLHLPFHEPKPIERTLEYFKDQKVTGIILQELMDCAALSYWMPTEKRDFLKEVERTCDFLDILKKNFPKCKIIIQQGNHDERLANYFNEHAPELIDMPGADMETILSADNRNIEVLERKQKITASELTIIHGHEMRGGSTVVSPARWAMLRGKACCAVGHWHTTSEATENDLNRKMVTCWSVGCLCDLEPDFSPVGNRWNWGCAILHHGTGNWEFVNRRILNNGKLV